MGSYSFHFPVGGNPTELFKEIPERPRKFLREGFDALARIFPQRSDVLLKLPVETFLPETQPDVTEFASSLHVPVSEARNVMGVMNFLALVATSPEAEVSPSAIVSAFVDSRLLDAGAKQPVEMILARFFNDRAKIDATYRRASVADRLLPSLENFELDIDVRFDFEKQEIALAVPVVLARIDTDAPHEEIWFQMTKSQAETMLKDLQQVLDRIASVEKWLPSSGK